jgi:hypothetical protein
MQRRVDKEERLLQQADEQMLARRSFLQRATVLAAVTAMAPAAFARNFGPGTEPQRYPDPDLIALDKRFKYKLGNTPIQRLYTGTLWAKGCAWNGASFAEMTMEGKTGFADGIRCDEDGNLWAAMGWVGDGYDGVHIT